MSQWVGLPAGPTGHRKRHARGCRHRIGRVSAHSLQHADRSRSSTPLEPAAKDWRTGPNPSLWQF